MGKASCTDLIDTFRANSINFAGLQEAQYLDTAVCKRLLKPKDGSACSVLKFQSATRRGVRQFVSTRAGLHDRRLGFSRRASGEIDSWLGYGHVLHLFQFICQLTEIKTL